MISDHRFILFYQCFNGLKLNAEDLERIVQGESWSRLDFERQLVSFQAKEYFEQVSSSWWQDSVAGLERAMDIGARWVHIFSDDYPMAWRELSSAPILFSYLGAPLWKTQRTISVVGSRNPKLETRIWMQRELSKFLRTEHVVLVSGGARGVDQWAHRLAVESGVGTVCIFPSGILNRYPPRSDSFWKYILENGGSLVSGFSPLAPMQKYFFHIRNRWIAGLAPVTFVVEANRQSGSYLTACLAMDEGRSVCTVPTFPLGEQGLGNLDLIGMGAGIVSSSEDLSAYYSLSAKENRRLGP